MFEASKPQQEHPTFGVWAPAGCPWRIEYSLNLIEEIRAQVSEGFQKLARGGVEVAGVLYGTRDGQTLHLTAFRPIACDHSGGPAFVLSEADKDALRAQLAPGSEPEGLNCLGWFVSHTRGEISLGPNDLEAFDQFFPVPSQLCLVIRPGRGGQMRAGFFVRTNDGLRTEESLEEFNFPDRLAGVIDHIGRDRRDGGDRRRPREHTLETVPLMTDIAPPSFQMAGSPSHSRWRWPVLGAWVLGFVALAGIAVPYYRGRTEQSPIALTLLEKQGVLQIDWNRTAEVTAAGAKGELAIVDGQRTEHIPLDAKDLQAGHFAYQRTTGEIEVRLSVRVPGGETIQEASRFLGRAPEGDASDTRRLQLEAEITRLKEENNAQHERIQQLERTLRVLQNRLGVK